MAQQNPTVIAASLDDSELKKSIDNLVAHVTTATDKIKKSFDDTASHIRKTFDSLKDVKVDINVDAITKQRQLKQEIKETVMSYDQLLGAMQLAQRRIALFNEKKFVTADDIDKYVAAIAKAAELQEKLNAKTREMAMLRAKQNESSWGFDAKTNIRSLDAVDERLIQLNKHYRELENQARKTAQGEMRTAFKMPTNDVDEVWRKILKIRELLQDNVKVNYFSSEQISNAEKMISKLHEIRREYEKQIETQKAAEQQAKNPAVDPKKILGDYRLHYARVMKLPTDSLDMAITKLEHLQMLLRANRDKGFMSPSQIAASEKEVQRLEQMVAKLDQTAKETTTSLRQATQTPAQNATQAAQATKQYSDEIKRLAQELRQAESVFKSQYGLSVSTTNDSGLRDYSIWMENRKSEYGETMSYEEQLLRLMKEKNMTYEQLVQRIREALVATEQMVNAERRRDAERRSSTTNAPTRFQDFENLRAAIAHVMKTEQSNILLVDQETASYNNLSKSLKQLQDAYHKLSARERNSDMGKTLANEIQITQRAVQQLQAQMSRPVSFRAVSGLSEKTLDDMAYKMRQLSSYRSGLDVDRQRDEINKVNREYDRLQRKMNEVMQKNQSLVMSNNTLTRSWNYMKNRLAFYFTVGASTQFIKNLIDVRSQYEMNERALGILINSAERGTQIFKELSQMSLVSPYTLIELSSAAKQLTAYGIAAKDVVDTTRRLADMAAAVGVPIERLTYALGQIQAYGYLNNRDARMFSNTGIPLVRELSKHYTELEGKLVSVGDVYDRIKKKAIGFNDVMAVINRMTDEGGKFFDFQAKMAGTLKVQLANLTLAWNNMLNDMGKSDQGIIVTSISGLKQLFLYWKKIDAIIWDIVWAFGAFKLGQFIYLLNRGVLTRVEGWNILIGKRLTNSFKTLGATMKSVFTSVGTWVTVGVMAIVDLIQTMKSARDAIRDFNKELSDAGKERFDNLTKGLKDFEKIRDALWAYQPQDDGTYKKMYPVNINSSEAQKAWETMRNLIEETSSQSTRLVGELLKIDDVNARLRKGFAYVDDIQAVNGAIQELKEDTLKISQNYEGWWNLWLAPEGLIGNFKDYHESLEKYEESYRKLEKIRESGREATRTELNYVDNQLKIMQEDARRAVEDWLKLTDSMVAFSDSKGFNVDQELELVSRVSEKISQDNQLSTKRQVQFRIDMESAYIESRKNLFNDEIEFEKKKSQEAKTKEESDMYMARAQRVEKERDGWIKQFGEGRAQFEEFTKWLKRNHSSEITDMFRNMTTQEREHFIKSSPEFKRWAKENAQSFIEQFGGSFDKLWKWIQETSGMTIFINTQIIGDVKGSYDYLTQQDKLADEAYQRLQRLTTRKNELDNINNKDKKQQQELKQVIEERTQAQKDLNKAEEEGGHSKAKEAEEKKAASAANKRNNAARKAQKDAETELQKAFKDELQLIDKVRSQYTKLTKAGVDGTTAMTMVTTQFKNSIGNINKVLSKNGLPMFDITKFAGTDDPHMVLEMLNKQLQAAKTAKNIKPSEIKDLEIKIGELIVDAKTYNMKKVTDGLNNELSKIKEEYELMVSIDAMPELGDIFTNLFNIDTSKMPKNIEEVVARYQDAINNGLVGALYGGADMDVDDLLAPFDLLTTDLADWATKTGVETGSTLYNGLQQAQKQIRDMVEKDKNETIKQIKELQYKLADTNGKIAIEEEKLEELRQKHAQETNEERRKLLELQIQDQENAIAKLKETILSELPTYKALFDGIVEHSSRMTRRLAQNYKKMLDDARKKGKNSDGKYVITDPINGEETEVSEEKLNKEIEKANNKLRETQSSFAKIKEALTTGEGKLVDWVKAIELIAGEAHKVADGVGEIANIAESLGASEETVDTFNAIADSIDGIATASEGVAQIANGDVIGGSVNVIKGLWQSISSWFDRSNKRITRQVKESERAVKQLENAYKNLEYAVEHSMGTAEMQARRAAIANKRLQITELENQLTLEKSRKKKNQDEDKIRELEGALIDARHELQDLSNDIMNTLLGSDIKSAAEEFVDTWVQAWRGGETTLEAIQEKMDEMVFNLIKKSATSKIVGNLLQPLYNAVDMFTTDSSEGGVAMTTNELKALASLAGQLGVDINEALGAFYGNLENLDIISKNMDNKELSALQQGIQGITEDTASALEAYMNGVSQQVYLHSDLLTQIRDAVVAMDGDIQMSFQAQMLLQLQQSYQMQSAIQSIMVGWSNPSGNAVKVELLN